jgi:hypothetical protein
VFNIAVDTRIAPTGVMPDREQLTRVKRKFQKCSLIADAEETKQVDTATFNEMNTITSGKRRRTAFYFIARKTAS